MAIDETTRKRWEKEDKTKKASLYIEFERMGMGNRYVKISYEVEKGEALLVDDKNIKLEPIYDKHSFLKGIRITRVEK